MTMKRQYFGTDGIRGRVNQHPITSPFCMQLGVALGHYFGQMHKGFRVVIGKDTRRSCYMIESALTAGLISVGANVMWLGPIPTPAIGMLTKSMRADFGMMISASHNLFGDNGVKLFNKDGYKLSDDIELEIEKLINQSHNIPLVDPSQLGRTIRYENAQARYIEIVKSSFPKDLSLEGLKIVVDCANGAAYRVAPQILFELGAEVISLGVNPDGFNINDHCGALHTEKLKEKVIREKADLGIALDGDADRIIMCDHKGNILNGDVLIGIIALALKNNHALRNNKIAITQMSNIALEHFMRQHQINVVKTNVGDRYVLQAMKEYNLALGGEQSGHIILSDYATTGDGLLAALQILAHMLKAQKTLHQVSQLFTPYPQQLTNITFGDHNPLNDKAIQDTIQAHQKDIEGKGRIYIRTSGTEPLLRILVEAQEQSTVDHYTKELTAILSKEIE